VAEFKSLGVTWSVTIDAYKIRTVRTRREFDLGAQDGQQLRALSADPVLAAEILWDLVESQAKAANVAEEAFFAALTGDVGEQAAFALFDAIIDFFPRGRREALRRLLDKDREIEAAGLDLAVGKLTNQETTQSLLDRLSRDIDAALAQALGATPSKSVSDSPASSAAPPPV
jgi:hypothetical protein